MEEIRNPDGYLIAKQDPKTGMVEIKDKRWVTRIECDAEGKPNITHIKAS